MDKIQRFQLKKILKNFGTAINGTGLILLFNNDQIIIFDTQGKAEQKDWKKVKYIKVQHVDNQNLKLFNNFTFADVKGKQIDIVSVL